MITLARLWGTALLVGASVGAPVAIGAQQKPADLTVFAAASLKDAFSEAADVLGKRNPPIAVRYSFAGSQQLVLQLEQGAAADVVASADQRWMQVAQDGGLVAGTPVIFARNRLLVITPASNPGRIDRLEDLGKRGLKLVLGAEAVPVGKYSREALDRLRGAPGFGTDYSKRVLRNLVSEEENVKAVVSKVQLGEADAGIVYVSDVTPPVRKAVRTIEIPDPYNVVAAYPIAVLRQSQQPAAARAFVEYITSAEGQAVLARHGLLPAEAAAKQPAAGAPR
ncbi:MAG TPA: molybdate ABC transporter substrate-binding protein [Gemmatimonadales bacterium]|nr:molybdate ABC transporter substrate-binding protein [Gemmatimonadales bacterium]